MENREKGVSSVEFVLILPLLLFIIFIIIEFSMVMFDKAVITNASREGARRGILAAPRTSETEIVRTVEIYTASNLISFGSSRSCDYHNGVGNLRHHRRTTSPYRSPIRYTFFVLPNFAGTLPQHITLTGVSVMRCE